MARDINRIDPFLKEIGEYWKLVPDWRFGQLFSNIVLTQEADPFFIEDDEMLNIFRRYCQKKEENELEKAIKNLKEIVDCIEDEDGNAENITAVLDWTDLKSLKIVLNSIENKM